MRWWATFGPQPFSLSSWNILFFLTNVVQLYTRRQERVYFMNSIMIWSKEFNTSVTYCLLCCWSNFFFIVVASSSFLIFTSPVRIPLWRCWMLMFSGVCFNVSFQQSSTAFIMQETLFSGQHAPKHRNKKKIGFGEEIKMGSSAGWVVIYFRKCCWAGITVFCVLTVQPHVATRTQNVLL